MAKFKCIASGNIIEFKAEVDIETTRENPAYEEVDETVEEPKKKAGRSAKQTEAE